MKLFKYAGYYPSGKKDKGIVVAPTKEEAERILKKKGIIPVKLKEKKIAVASIFPISNEEWSFLFSTYGRYLKAGVSVQQATLNMIEEQFNSKLSLFLYEVLSYLNEGLKFSQALERTGKLPKSVIETIRIGEETGKLAEVLFHLRDRFKEKAKIKKKLIEALFTPALIITITIGFMFYAPKLIKQFERLYSKFPKAEFPAYSKFMIAFLNAFGKLLPVILMFSALSVFLFVKLYKDSEKFKRTVDSLLLSIPVIKDTILIAHVYDAFLELEILYSSGIPPQRAIEMIERATNNSVLKEAWSKVLEAIHKGEPFHQALKLNPYVPPLVKSLVVFGIESGALSEELEEIVEYLREKFQAHMQFIKSTVEPAMLLVSAGLVLAVLLAIYLPLFDIGKLFQQLH